MKRGRGYLPVISCLLILLAQTVHAQHAPAGLPGFVPKHLQMQRVRGPMQDPRGRPRVNPFAQPAAGRETHSANDGVRTASYDQPFQDHLIIVDDATALTQPLDAPVMEPLPSAEPGWDMASLDASLCNSWCPPVVWFAADYIGWETRDADAPALATTSAAGTPRDTAGVLGEPGVSTLFGGDGIHGDWRSGARFTLGGWFSTQRACGIQISYTVLGEDEESFTGSARDFPILARPFFNMRLFEEDSRLINFPDLVRGNLRIHSSSEFDSVEVMFLRPAAQEFGSTRLMVGYRHANLDELLRIDETTVSLESPTLDSTFDLFDEFSTDNSFHGYQIGVHHVGQLGTCWWYDLIGKAAIGNTHSRLRINGQTVTTTANGDVATSPEGLLAVSTNIGSDSDDKLSSLFELGINLRRYCRNGLHLRIGYSYLHWSSVLRAVEQIDRDITPSEIPPDTRVGPQRPRARLKHSGFWAQGLNAGLEYQF